jgi:tetratricopeptide (TPR) repeat protein
LLASAALLGREFSVGVVASVADLAESAVFEALEEARRAGIAEPGPRGHWRFVHALVLEAIAGELAPVLRMQLHGRIGEVLGAEVDQGDGARALEVAHHLSRAAERLMLQAAEAAARAARHAERSLAFADAASAYESALELRSRAGADDPAERCELLLGLAQARLSARDVQGAWESARRAAELAREIASPVQLARAALVLGAHFHIGFEAPLALLEEVLPALPADAPALRSAVLSTITAQLHYARQPKRRIELAEQSLEAARRAGSPEIVALALMAMRNALCAPEAISVRLQVGSERVEWADRVPHSAQRCLARGERAVDRYAAGDIDAAEQDVVDIERIAREIPVRSMQSFPARWRCLRANAEGRFADAETAARAAFELTRQADDPNAIPNLTMQLGMVRYEQGRWEELDAMVAGASGWLAPYRAVAPAVRACLANFELLRGRCDAALADYRHLVGDEFAALDGDPEPLVTSSWLAGMMRRLGDAERAERLYERLSSYGDQFVIFNFAVAARGSFARYLGLLAHAAGRFEDAERHLERAIAANQRIGATLYVARARADEAALLAARGAPGDRERSIELERAARSAFERFGVRESGRAPGV